MRREDLRDLCTHLMELRVNYVLVGGAAVELAGFPIGTEDADFAVTLREYGATLRKLQDDPRFRDVEDLRTIGGAQFFTGTSWIEVEFLNPILFRGRRSDRYFIDYVRRYRSRSTEFGPVAMPEVAWYMRLVVPDWEVYVQKIVRDVRAGVPVEILEGAIAVARAVGAAGTIAPRVDKVRATLALIR